MEPPKPSKKDIAKADKLRLHQEAAAAATAVTAVTLDPLSSNYGDTPLADISSPPTFQTRVWNTVDSLGKKMEGESVLIRGRVSATRQFSKKLAFFTVRASDFSVQCVLSVAQGLASANMVKFAAGITSL